MNIDIIALATKCGFSTVEDRTIYLSKYSKEKLHDCILKLATLLEAEIRKEYGDSCIDEGCPHYGTKHSHPSGAQAVAYLVDGRQEQGLFFDKEAAEVMADANCGNVVDLFPAPPSAIAIETSAKLQAAEVCQDYATAAIAHDFTIAADSWWAIRKEILATIPQDGITELEKFGMLVANRVCDEASAWHLPTQDQLRAIVKSLIEGHHA